MFCFPLRLEVSSLFLDIKTKAEVRDAAESWKLGVKRNEECLFADWPIVVLMVSSWAATDKLTWCNKHGPEVITQSVTDSSPHESYNSSLQICIYVFFI